MGREKREDGKPKKRRAHSWQEKREELCSLSVGEDSDSNLRMGLDFRVPMIWGLDSILISSLRHI
ncbi:unnamed protein product [Prunus armeniaca]